MSFKFEKGISVCLVSLCMMFIGNPETIVAQTTSNPAEEEQESDDPETFAKKRRSEAAWETIVSFPGRLVYMPIKVFLTGSVALASYIDDSKVVFIINDYLNSDDGRRSVQPVYAARTGGGIAYIQRGLITETSRLTLQATAGLRQRQRYIASIRDVRLGNTAHFGLGAYYQFLSDESFFGLGNDSEERNESNYAHRQSAAELTLGLSLGNSVTLDGLLGYESNEIEEGKDKSLPSTTDPILFPEGTLPGLTEKVEFSKIQLVLHYDGKNHPGRPTAGGELMVNGGLFSEIGDSNFGFWKASFDISHYVNLFYGRIILLRVAGEITEALSDKKIPFYYLSEIGRQETVRGFRRGRFRGNDMLMGSLEYRYPIWHYFDAVLFADAGKVSEDIINDFSTDDLHVGYGGGMRIWGQSGMIAKFEIGNSKDGIRLYFELNKGL